MSKTIEIPRHMKFEKMKLENKYQQAVYSLYINMINMVYIFPFYMLSY